MRDSLTSKFVVENKMSGTRRDGTLGKVKTSLFDMFSGTPTLNKLLEFI